MATSTMSLEERLENVTREEAQKILSEYLESIKFKPEYYLLDLDAAMESVHMKRTTFDKYMRYQPEMLAIEAHPTDKAGRVSVKPFYDPDEFKLAVKNIKAKWSFGNDKNR